MGKQKFNRGDIVRVADDLGQYMAHFKSGYDAIVIGSYADQFGGKNVKSFTLMDVDTGSTSSWYDDWQLEFIRHGGEELIKEIETRRDSVAAKESDLDWIIDNWKDIRNKPSGATAESVMRHIGITNPWGSRGEGFTWCQNWLGTLGCVDDVLLSGDRSAIEHRFKVVREKLSHG